jgi:hypothetical protein
MPIFLNALLVAASFVAGSIITALSSAACEYLKWFAPALGALATTFIGADLAFRFNTRKDENAKRREEIAAGRFAVSSLSTLASDFFAVKQTVQANASMLWPPTPVWMMQPVFGPQPEIALDFRPLTFLFDDPDGVPVYEALGEAKRVCNTLFTLITAHLSVSDELLRALAAAGLRGSGTAEEIEQAAGPVVIARAKTLTSGILELVSGDAEHAVRDACAKLPMLLRARFGDDFNHRIMLPSEE